jgi:metal-responsive CopG/Arc/MetJ family transcriptional regulator
MKSYISTGLSLPYKLLRKIDTERGDVSRSRYILRLLEKIYKDERYEEHQDPPDHRFESLQSSESRGPKR